MSRLLLSSALAALVLPALAAAPLRFCDVCAGYTISKRGDDVLIRCPGVADPWLTIKNCRNPNAQRDGSNLTITCQ